VSLWPFRLRRDSSADAIPVAGYQDGVDAIDTIHWGTRSVTETLNTDSSGYVTLTYNPIDITHDWITDADQTPRERKIDGADISALTAGGATLFPGQFNGQTKRGQLFTDSAHTVAAANLAGVVVTYVTISRLATDANGNLITISGGGTGTVADISDRAARQLGQVSPVPGFGWDILDRSTRLLGKTQLLGGWSKYHAPGAANTQATCNIAGNAGVVHVCRVVSAVLFSAGGGGSAWSVDLVLRDGAPGVGTVLWQTTLSVSGAAAATDRINLSDLNVAGTAGNAMTLETTAGGGSGNTLRVAMTGIDQ
jgi:hypothetical protein